MTNNSYLFTLQNKCIERKFSKSIADVTTFPKEVYKLILYMCNIANVPNCDTVYVI